MMRFTIALACLSTLVPAHASDTLRQSNLKCEGGWVTVGTSKLTVVSYCGQPKATDRTSGDSERKREDLLFTIENKDYVVSIVDGKVIRIGSVK
jgi:hypothetical protein